MIQSASLLKLVSNMIVNLYFNNEYPVNELKRDISLKVLKEGFWGL